MSLMKLLTVGRSFMREQTSLGRYQMVGRRSALPQFGRIHHSHSGAGAPPAARRVAPRQVELPKLLPTPDVHAPESPAAPPSPTVPRIRNPFTRPAAASASARPEQPGRAGRVRWSMARVGDWLWGKRGGRGVLPFGGKASRQPGQGKLNLDRVQVVRNDLSDSDFEVKPGGALALKAGLAGLVGSGPKPQPEGAPWAPAAGRGIQDGRGRVLTR